MPEDPKTATLAVMRHGQSAWTVKDVNRFAGWADIPLTDRGREQAAHAGGLLRRAGIVPDAVFTSVLERAIVTADIVLETLGCLWTPEHRSWRLNERHYGALQGETRPDMRRRYGEELFNSYRRGYDVRPPQIAPDSPWCQARDPRYRPRALELSDIAPDGSPLGGPDPAKIRSEALADVGLRLDPLWRAWVAPLLASGRTVLVCTHGSVVRSIMMRVEGKSPDEARRAEIPTGVPLAYEVDRETLRAVAPARYLDEAAAEAGIEAVRAL